MRLHKLDFVDIFKEGEKYIHVYAVFAKSFFKKHYLKFTFVSDLPHYYWTDVQKTMTRDKLYFEDLVEGKPTKLEIGTIRYAHFVDDDFQQFGTDLDNWKRLLDDALDKQKVFQDEYNEKFGSPELPDYLKWT